ncbi:MAG: ArsC/Spx/MgsR family protein [Shimia sp.]
MVLYGLGNCDTCRKARKALPSAQFVDVRAEGVPQDTIRNAFEAFGDTLMNRRSTTWRELSEAERARDPIALLIDHPTLMKRPLIVEGDRMTLGWDKAAQNTWT